MWGDEYTDTTKQTEVNALKFITKSIEDKKAYSLFHKKLKVFVTP